MIQTSKTNNNANNNNNNRLIITTTNKPQQQLNKKINNNLCTKEFEINDVRIAVRNILTKVSCLCFSVFYFKVGFDLGI